MKKYVTTFVLAVLVLVQSSLTCAAENRFQQFNMDVQKAYGDYRTALFQTNKKDSDKSQKAVLSFQKAWKEIIAMYGAAPPETFSSDPVWSQTLDGIYEIATESAEQIKGGDLAMAHETLEAIRDDLSELRHRNSVISFSDHINNYHEVMEGLLTADHPPELGNAEEMNHLRGQLAVLRYLAEAIKDNAPQQYVDNKKFQQLQEGLFASLDQLEQAIAENAQDKISKAVMMLKPAYAKLFLNFG